MTEELVRLMMYFLWFRKAVHVYRVGAKLLDVN